MMKSLVLSLFMAATLGSVSLANDVRLRFESPYGTRTAILEGDDDHNHIEVRRIYQNLYQLKGRNGTTVNGEGEIYRWIDTRNIRIETHGGNDTIEISRATAGWVGIFPGTGDDTVDVSNSQITALKISKPEGDDGDDVFLVENCEGRDWVSLNSGEGRDFLQVILSDYMSIGLESAGRTTYSVSHNELNLLEIEGALTESSTIHCYGNSPRYSSIRILVATGFRSDRVNIVDNIVGSFSGSYVATGAGDDRITYQHNPMRGQMIIDAGPGNDQGTIRKSFFLDRLFVENFESPVR